MSEADNTYFPGKERWSEKGSGVPVSMFETETPKKKTSRKRLALYIGAGIGALAAVASLAGGDPDGPAPAPPTTAVSVLPSAGQAGNTSTLATAAQSTTEAPKAKTEKDDIEVTGHSGSTASVVITNHSSKLSDYFFSINVSSADGRTPVGKCIFSTSGLGAGESVAVEENCFGSDYSTLGDMPSDAKLTVVNVTRMAHSD
jgi:hypothetical protein